MTDNFDLIADYISEFDIDQDTFFHISVMIRHKDVEWFPKGKNNNARTIYSLNISSVEELYDNKLLITTLCNSLKARAYICIIPKSYKKAAANALENATQSFITENYKGLQSSWSKGVSKSSKVAYNRFLVDIDESELTRADEIIKYINEELDPSGDKEIISIPSKTGVHLICKKFNSKKFVEKFPNIDIKKHGLTILYTF